MSVGQLINLSYYQLLHKNLRSVFSDIYGEEHIANNLNPIPLYAHNLDINYQSNLVDETHGYGRIVPYIEKTISSDYIYNDEWNRIYHMLHEIYFHQDYHLDSYQSDLFYYTIPLVNEGDGILTIESSLFYGKITNISLINVINNSSNNLISNPLFKTNDKWLITGSWEIISDSYVQGKGTGSLRYDLSEVIGTGQSFLLSFTISMSPEDQPNESSPPDGAEIYFRLGSDNNQFTLDVVSEFPGNEIPIHNYIDIAKEKIFSYNDQLNVDIGDINSISSRLIDTRLSISDNYTDSVGIRKYIYDTNKNQIVTSSREEGWTGLLKHRFSLFAVNYKEHLSYIYESEEGNRLRDFETDPYSNKDLMRYYFNSGGEIYIEIDIATKDINNLVDATSTEFRDFIMNNNLNRIGITSDSVYSYSSSTVNISSKDLFSDSSNRTLLTPGGGDVKRGYYIDVHDSDTYSTLSDPNNPPPEFLDDEGVLDPGGGFGELLYTHQETVGSNIYDFKLYRKREFEEEYRNRVSEGDLLSNLSNNDRCTFTVLFSAKDTGDENLDILYPISITISESLPSILGYTDSFDFSYIPPSFIEEEVSEEEEVYKTPTMSDGSIAFDKDDFRYNENCQIPPSISEESLLPDKDPYIESGGIPSNLSEPLVVIHRDDTSYTIGLDESQVGDLEIGFSMSGNLDEFYEGMLQNGSIIFRGRYTDYSIDGLGLIVTKYSEDGSAKISFNESGLYKDENDPDNPNSISVGKDPRLSTTTEKNVSYFSMKRSEATNDRVYLYTFIPEGLSDDIYHTKIYTHANVFLQITISAKNIDTNDVERYVLSKDLTIKKVDGPTVEISYRPDFSYTLQSQRTTQSIGGTTPSYNGIISKDSYIPRVVDGVSSVNKSVRKYEIDVYEDDILHFELSIEPTNNKYKPLFYNVNDPSSNENEYLFIRKSGMSESPTKIQFAVDSDKINEYLPYDKDKKTAFENPSSYEFPINLELSEGSVLQDREGYLNDSGLKKINLIYSEIDNSGELSRRRHLYIGGLRCKGDLLPGTSEKTSVSMKLSDDVKPYDPDGVDVQDSRGFHYDYINHNPEIDFEFNLIKAIYSTYQDFGPDSVSISSINMDSNPSDLSPDQGTHNTLSNRVVSEMLGTYTFSQINDFRRIEILIDGSIRSESPDISALEIDVKSNSENNLPYDFSFLNQYSTISLVNYSTISGSKGTGGKGQDENGFAKPGSKGGLVYYIPSQTNDFKRRYFLLSGGLRNNDVSLRGKSYIPGGGGGGGSATLKVELIPVTSKHYTISSSGKVEYK